MAINKIVEENLKQGNPESEWGLVGVGSTSIEGFATDISTNIGGIVDLKIDTDATDYRVDIYRLGHYGGDGARKVGSITHQSAAGNGQPDPLTDGNTGLVDAGNWHVTDSWQVPEDAASGVYIAKLIRLDGTQGENHIPFIIRDDSGQSDVIFKTSDTTWQAYNSWGGNSLYEGGDVAVSYNRPITTADGDALSPARPWNFIFGAEYPAIRWLEANGYDVSYMAGVDAARSSSELLEHKAFLSVGHDEYWSGEERGAVEAARDAGVNLAFWSGNEVYWKTRWDSSIDSSETPYRTLVSYRERFADDGTLFSGSPDPSDVWTGQWRDNRFASPGEQITPENALTGTLYYVDLDLTTPLNTIGVTDDYSKLRFWRDTDVAALEQGQTTWLGRDYLGYEWDVDYDNGFRPAGLINLSSTTIQSNAVLQDYYAHTVAPGSATHSLNLYRADSGALVFGAGTIFWSWGLDTNHSAGPNGWGAGAPSDKNVQQSMINLFADMGIQPETLRLGLVKATQSTDHTAPTSTISSVSGFLANNAATISGTSADTGGSAVNTEVSTDGGISWHRAPSVEGNWTYTWIPTKTGDQHVLIRTVDDSLNLEVPISFNMHIDYAVSSIVTDFSVAQGWTSQTYTRFFADIDGNGTADYVGFGEAATLAVRGSLSSTLGSPGPGLDLGDGFITYIPDFGQSEGYSLSNFRGVEFTGDYVSLTGGSASHLATVWAQNEQGISFYAATEFTSGVDSMGVAYKTPIYQPTPTTIADFGVNQGWAQSYALDVAFIKATDQFASVVGFDGNGMTISAQALNPMTAATVKSYHVAGSEQFGNGNGWDETVDIRAVSDYRGKPIDLNGDGITDVVGMGPAGLTYSLGQNIGASGAGTYSLGLTHTISGSGPDFGGDEGWNNIDTLRYLADVNGDGHLDAVGFGEAGVWVSLGQSPTSDGTNAFNQAYLAVEDFGTAQGWTTTDHVRKLGNMNGDNVLDIVGFGDDNTFIAFGNKADDGTVTWNITSALADYGSNKGWLKDVHQREIADVDGNGTDDIVVSGDFDTQVIGHFS